MLSDPYAPQPEPRGGAEEWVAAPRGSAGLLRKAVPVDRDPASGRWHGPFVMAGFNTRVVRLSNTLTDWSYGREFRYREVVDFGKGPLSPVLAAGMAIGLTGGLAGLSWAPSRAVLDRLLPKPGEGPSEEQMAAGRFLMETRTTTTTGPGTWPASEHRTTRATRERRSCWARARWLSPSTGTASRAARES